MVPEEADERKLEAELESINVEDELQKLFARKSTLSEKELDFYSARLNDGEILKSKENRLFLASILKDLEAGQDNLQIDTKILDFMKNHVGITWCVSLRRIVAGL
ncbi:DEKNAAC102427 [Brettanomyces naardenensis]|uniref:DEKNAAC102427 n=1 Tax=Brettanomyces naardenensis TaxID=13370 RepID=A0A448YK42_BRENA|nr:DEKNAAC102427 [Brettanomyces naardenensis]